MNRKELYQKIKKYDLGDVVKFITNKDYTHVPNHELEYIINSSNKEQKKVAVKESNPIEKLVEVLKKKNLLLPSEVDYILN